MTPTESEALVQSRVRLEAARDPNIWLGRNNSGAFKAPDRTQPQCPTCGQHPPAQRLVRFGLGNDSAQVNDALKSHDLIGIRATVIMPEHVGSVFGRFVSRECKPKGWTYAGTDRERAQLAFGDLINRFGGDAAFCTGEGTL